MTKVRETVVLRPCINIGNEGFSEKSVMTFQRLLLVYYINRENYYASRKDCIRLSACSKVFIEQAYDIRKYPSPYTVNALPGTTATLPSLASLRAKSNEESYPFGSFTKK